MSQSIEQTPLTIDNINTDYTTWMKHNFPVDCILFTNNEAMVVVNNLLALSKFFEDYIYLSFKRFAIVISKDLPNSDENILKHYGNKGILSYESLLSRDILPGRMHRIRVSYVSFVEDESCVHLCSPCVNLKEQAKSRDEVQYKLSYESGSHWTLCFAWRNVDLRYFMYRIAYTCRLKEIQIYKTQFGVTNLISNEALLFGKLELIGESLNNEHLRNAFIREFSALRDVGIDDKIKDELVEKKVISNNKAMLLRAFITLTAQLLGEIDGNLYNEDNVKEAVVFHPDLTKDILKAFSLKFHPENQRIEEYTLLVNELEKQCDGIDTGRKSNDERRRIIFSTIIILLKSILKTNFYCLGKLAIGFRLDPQLFELIPGLKETHAFTEIPFGIFYVKSNDFFGFHVRFRNLARGGLRTVITKDADQAEFERRHILRECYNLASTQQLKNKDIPEGGSKGIIYLAPSQAKNEAVIIKEKLRIDNSYDQSIIEKYISQKEVEYLYQSQRAYVKTLLTLIVMKKGGLEAKNVVDYYGKTEPIYLGPDENMHDCIIEWIAQEAMRVGYEIGGAFISGKKAGINHKKYGVTSRGVFQYLKEGLKAIGMEGKNYTMKITGGPDGDVGGNLIKLLEEKESTKVKLQVIVDGTACIYDPEGLNLKILSQFFEEKKGVVFYPAEELHENGFLLKIHHMRERNSLNNETLIIWKKNGKVQEEWIASNKAMHLYTTIAHTTVTDVFCPCGGRPRTLNKDNITTFFIDGKPTSKLIVEGANLYNTEEARRILEKEGVLIFKDSSANKCGVISSSFEILAGLVLTDIEFFDIKNEYAKDIISRLEELARKEARCMVNFKQNHPDQFMSDISTLVSKRINEITDCLNLYLEDKDLFHIKNKRLLDICIDYLPSLLKKNYMELSLRKIPQYHMKAIIATSIACDLIYSHGLDWQISVIDILPSILEGCSKK